jgi:hypothetical protein
MHPSFFVTTVNYKFKIFTALAHELVKIFWPNLKNLQSHVNLSFIKNIDCWVHRVYTASNLIAYLASNCSTVVKHLPHHLMVESLSPADTPDDTMREKIGIKSGLTSWPAVGNCNIDFLNFCNHQV